MIKICLAGATGWTGKALATALHASAEFELTSALTRTTGGKDLGEVIADTHWGTPIYSDLNKALTGVDVMIEYTGHASVKANTLAAIAAGVHVVVGSSGMSAADFAEIESAAKAKMLA